MRLSIRVKLVSLLVAVALLPLMVSILTIAIGGRKLRSEVVAQSFQSIAVSEATTLDISLAKDIEKVLLSTSEATAVLGPDSPSEPLGEDELAELDRAWPTLSRDDYRMASILDNDIANDLRRIQVEDPRFVEIFVTDRFGQLVAATGRTTDFYQADESWWQGVAGAGEPRVFVPPVHYDASSGAWSIDLCIPVVSEGQLIGVTKAVLDLSKWIRKPKASVGGVRPSAMFVRANGTILYREGTEPLTAKAGQWYGPIAEGKAAGWRTTSDGQIQAFAPIVLAERVDSFEVSMPKWSLVLYLSEAEALGAVVRLSLVVMALGIVIVLLIFFLGLFVVDRIITLRIYRLQGATQSIARGDLSHRINLPKSGRWGYDEIDELAGNFNDMVERVQHSHESLTAADDLKRDFIRIAGHELRTPVSYILGTVRLLKDCTDSRRLVQAIQTMGAKAKRLDEIISAMFKLMPDRPGGLELRYEDVGIAELLEEVYIDCFPFVEQRGQRLLIEGANRIASIRADKAKLRDILENLLLNAIKFTPDGGTVKVRVSRQLGDYVSFAVQDQGSGIAESDLPHVFKPFYSGGDVMKHSSGLYGHGKKGIGLGLAIVRHFVELHGGTISTSSQPHGCVLTVTIPIREK